MLKKQLFSQEAGSTFVKKGTISFKKIDSSSSILLPSRLLLSVPELHRIHRPRPSGQRSGHGLSAKHRLNASPPVGNCAPPRRNMLCSSLYFAGRPLSTEPRARPAPLTSILLAGIYAGCAFSHTNLFQTATSAIQQPAHLQRAHCTSLQCRTCCAHTIQRFSTIDQITNVPCRY